MSDTGTLGRTSASRAEELFKAANRAQRAEIVGHRDKMMRELGRVVSLDEAAEEWIRNHAAEWRAEFDRTTSGRV